MTDKQRNVLRYVTDFIAKHGFGPTLAEIVEALDLKTKSRAHALVTRLVELGHLVRHPNRDRGLALPDRSVLSGYAAPELAAELQRRGWAVYAPAPELARG